MNDPVGARLLSADGGQPVSSDLLAQVVRALASSTDASGALTAMSALLVPSVAEWVLADRLQPPDLVHRVAAVGTAGPLALPLDMGQEHARRSTAQAVGILARLEDAPGKRLRLDAQDLQASASSPDPRLRAQAEMALSLGTLDLAVLGLAHRDEVLGVLALGRSGRRFDDDDMTLLQDVAVAAGLALEALRLQELQRGLSTALQRSLLPALPVVPGVTLAARFSPSEEGLAVGGDWYDVFLTAAGGLALVVGDATGHDVRAAARMAELRNLLRAVAVDRQGGPADTLRRLDAVIARLAPELSGTAVYAQVETDDGAGRLRWSSAGHLPPVLLRGGRAELLRTPADLMLGVQAGAQRTDHGLDLRAGDLLLLYTDGLVEDRRTDLDVRLDGLARLLEQLQPDHLEHLVDTVVDRLASREDDVAVLAVRLDPRDGPATRS